MYESFDKNVHYETYVSDIGLALWQALLLPFQSGDINKTPKKLFCVINSSPTENNRSKRS